jgi:two-component system response regulator FixJ
MLRIDAVRSQSEPEVSGKLAYIIDDDREMRMSLRLLLQGSDIAARPFLSATDFLDELASLKPAPILLDLRMPGMDGIALLEILAERSLGWPVIMMTGHAEVPLAVKAMKLGALDFLEKPFSYGDLTAGMKRAFLLLEEQAKKTGLSEARARLERLTRRERQILTAVANGLSNKEIALALALSHRTVEMHRSRMMRRLGARRLSEVIALAAALQ